MSIHRIHSAPQPALAADHLQVLPKAGFQILFGETAQMVQQRLRIDHGVEPTPLTDERIEGASLHDVLLDSRTILLPNTEAVGADRCCHRLEGIETCHPFYF